MSNEYITDINIIKDVISNINELYGDGTFRHTYSDIYAFINNDDIFEDAYCDQISNIEFNLSEIKDFARENKSLSENADKGLNKLIDHTLLEISRAREVYSKTNELKSKLKSAEEEYTKLDSNTKEINELFELVNKQLQQYKGDIIVVVSLLVSIIPLLATNISYISQELSLLAILMCNGTMMLVIGIVFSLISFIVDQRYKILIPAAIMAILGVVMIVYSISLGNVDISKSITDISCLGLVTKL